MLTAACSRSADKRTLQLINCDFLSRPPDGRRWLLWRVLLCGLALAAAVDGASAQRTDPFATRAQRPPAPSAFWPGAGLPCARPDVLPDPLRLSEVIDLALCNNAQTRESWASAKAQAAALGIAQSFYLPDITGSVSVQRSEVRNVRNSGGTSTLDAAISINYLLFDFGGRDANVELARQSLLAANWSHNNTLQLVMLGAVQGYYQLYATQEAVQATLAAEKAALTSLEAARARQKAGTATRADVLQTQTAYSQAQLNRTQAEGDAAVAKGVLANAMGLSAERPLRIAQPPDLQMQKTAEQAVESLIETARSRRPDLAAAEAQVRAGQSNIRVQEAAAKPSLSAFGSIGQTLASPGSDPRTGAIGLQLTIPLFTGFRNTYRILQAREQLEIDQATRDRLSTDVALDVWRAYQDLRTQRQSLDTANDLVASAQENYNVALGRYRAGVGTITDLLNAQSALVNAELQRIQARFRWNLAKATLARSIGVLDPALIAGALAPTSGGQ
ncbi:MAG TPA: TolC family protein [Burkholderiales bacterium]|nr:TolC family protein [Burkholderiales bacterium]